jgi:hypothetical protein
MFQVTQASAALAGSVSNALNNSSPHSLHPLPPIIKLLPATSEVTQDVDAYITSMVELPLNRANNPAVAESVGCTIALHSLASPHTNATSSALSLPVSLLPALYKCAYRKLKSLNLLLGNEKGNVLCGGVLPAIKDLHRLAILMDQPFGTGLSDHERLEATVTLRQDPFSKTSNDRANFPVLTAAQSDTLSASGSKKALVLPVVNVLFASYFTLNTLRLCKNIQKPVEKGRLHEAANNLGGMSAMLTYRFYTARLGMFEDQYDEAEADLSYVYLNCPSTPTGTANRRRALRYLIPVRLQRGVLPSMELLAEYDLTGMFGDVVLGLRCGNLQLFNDGLRSNAHAFMRSGTFLLLEKCKVLCYRNLFKRVHTVTGKTQMPLGDLTLTFKWLGVEVDDDEVECILANLIFHGYVKGYISHSKRILVLSKKDAFPQSAFKTA